MSYASHSGPHDWSNPIAELSGGRACRRCGKIADRLERGQIYFREKKERAKCAARRLKRAGSQM